MTIRRYTGDGHRRVHIWLCHDQTVSIHRSAEWPPGEWYLTVWRTAGLETAWINRVTARAFIRLSALSGG